LEQLEKEESFYLSSVTLRELEGIKTSKVKSDEVKFAARKAVRWLDSNEEKYTVVVYEDCMRTACLDIVEDLEETNDLKIMLCAKWVDAVEGISIEFCTNDILCKIIAKEYLGLNVCSLEENTDGIYKGYKTIRGTSHEINEIMDKIDYSDWNVNEYLIIENTDDDSSKELRFNGTEFVSLKLPPSKFIKGKNSLQRCALDAMLNPDITISAILGTYGSGKTFMALQMALYNVREKGNQGKILGVREMIGQGKEIGYLPGDMENKIGAFFEPLTQSLNGGEYELEGLKQSGVLDTNIPYFMKGTTYNDTVIVCDEAEDLSEAQIRLIGTRLGSNSKIYFSGDYKQSLINKTNTNALVKMCNELKGNPKFACICLDEDVRSETSKLFADLFKR